MLFVSLFLLFFSFHDTTDDVGGRREKALLGRKDLAHVDGCIRHDSCACGRSKKAKTSRLRWIAVRDGLGCRPYASLTIPSICTFVLVKKELD